jgi:short-subunit dehydrogenase involved in D-alanine esterification of teichoic acids
MISELFHLSGNAAIITGGTMGIGHGIAMRLTDEKKPPEA